jgi:phosphatidylglycerophosphatase A
LASAIAASFYYFLPMLKQQILLLAVLFILFVLGWKAVVVVIATGGEGDPGFVVLDEVVGQVLALVSPIHQGNPVFVLLSFSLFRLFDITKPFPASWFNRQSGGIHVMMDDIVAGLYANIVTHIIIWVAYWN